MERSSSSESTQSDKMENNNTTGSSTQKTPASGGLKRKFSEDLIFELPLVQDVMDTLQCPACQEVPIPPIRIYTCKVGHNVCGSCKTKLNKCALCRNKLTEKRNFFAEKLLNASSFKCNNEKYGCLETLKGSEHEDHIKSCRHRPFLCWEQENEPCLGVPVQLNLYLDHLKKKHLVTGKSITDEKLSTVGLSWALKNNPIIYNGDQSWIQYIMFHNKEFLLYVTIKGEMLTAWMTLLDISDDFKRHRATLRIVSPNSPCTGIWVFPIQPVHADMNSILESGQCATMSAKTLKPYLQNQNSDPVYKLNFTVKLEKSKIV